MIKTSFVRSVPRGRPASRRPVTVRSPSRPGGRPASTAGDRARYVETGAGPPRRIEPGPPRRPATVVRRGRNDSTGPATAVRRGRSASRAGADAQPLRVPCSKRDVFAAPDLSAADKRRLMRLLRAAQDRGEDDPETLNERGLTSSRALRRPQNRPAARAAADGTASFAASLENDDGLPPRLAKAVAYVRRADLSPVDRGDAAAGRASDESRRRRG